MRLKRRNIVAPTIPTLTHRILVCFSFSSRSGFRCMTFYRRDGHVIEVQTGVAVSRPEEACSPPYFQQHSIPFLTLVSEYNFFSLSRSFILAHFPIFAKYLIGEILPPPRTKRAMCIFPCTFRAEVFQLFASSRREIAATPCNSAGIFVRGLAPRFE